MQNYSSEFINYLVKKGYEKPLLKTQKIKSRGDMYDGVIVGEKDRKTTVIQAFALMSDKDRRKHRLYPFYRTQPWGEANTSVYPSCSIATREINGEWSIYNAHDSSQKRDSDYLNYGLALERFHRRMKAEPIRSMGSSFKYISWSLATFLGVYYILTKIFPGQLPVIDGSTVTLFAVIIVLILLPILIPFIKGISVFGIEVFFNKTE